jgi:hypothetical protein
MSVRHGGDEATGTREGRFNHNILRVDEIAEHEHEKRRLL